MQWTHSDNDNSKYHIPSIGALRGLAAISVFFFHMWSFNLPESGIYRPWFFLLAGHEAVIFFYVLSGFILTFSYEHGHLSYVQYCIRRIFRIYPAYYAAMILGIILFLWLKPLPLIQYTPWFNSQFSNIQLSSKTLIDTLLMITNPVSKINGIVWSLVYEVTISTMILPVLWKFKTNKSLSILILLYIIFFIQRQIIHPGYIIIDRSIYFSVFFYMGYLVYHLGNKLAFLAKPIYLPIYILCYSSLYFSYGNYIFTKATIRDILSGIGAVGFLCMALYHTKTKAILKNRIINFYGEISYSFYLFHIGIMYGIVYSCKNYLPLSIMIILIFLITTAISTISYFTIEKPFTKLSKKLI